MYMYGQSVALGETRDAAAAFLAAPSHSVMISIFPESGKSRYYTVRKTADTPCDVSRARGPPALSSASFDVNSREQKQHPLSLQLGHVSYSFCD
jgi:hypothetical protein